MSLVTIILPNLFSYPCSLFSWFPDIWCFIFLLSTHWLSLPRFSFFLIFAWLNPCMWSKVRQKFYKLNLIYVRCILIFSILLYSILLFEKSSGQTHFNRFQEEWVKEWPIVWSILFLEHWSDYVLSFLLNLWWLYIAFHMKFQFLSRMTPRSLSDHFSISPGRRQQTVVGALESEGQELRAGLWHLPVLWPWKS